MGKPKKATNIDKSIGLKLKEAREHAGISLETLAIELNITLMQVWKYENGLNRISAGRLWEISQLFDRSVAWFFPSDVE